jgi:hypothetical protein
MKNSSENFESMLIIVLETKLLKRLSAVSKVLKSESMNLKITSDLLKKIT